MSFWTGPINEPFAFEAEIEKIGVLRNPVISWQDGHGEPAPPRVRW